MFWVPRKISTVGRPPLLLFPECDPTFQTHKCHSRTNPEYPKVTSFPLSQSIDATDTIHVIVSVPLFATLEIRRFTLSNERHCKRFFIFPATPEEKERKKLLVFRWDYHSRVCVDSFIDFFLFFFFQENLYSRVDTLIPIVLYASTLDEGNAICCPIRSRVLRYIFS